ncbi:uncharacterized protein TNCV_492081 [Trichonephila clavipes]|nr:uncharacterized protein TNCV_492081 [Trichonephila clavipes]
MPKTQTCITRKAKNDDDRAAIRIYHAQFPDRRMPDHRIFQWLVHQLVKQVRTTRYDAGQRKVVRSPSLEGSTLNVMADRPESNTSVVVHPLSVSHQTVCTVLKGHRLHFRRVKALNPDRYLLRLPVGGTAMYATAGLHSSCAEQLLIVITIGYGHKLVAAVVESRARVLMPLKTRHVEELTHVKSFEAQNIPIGEECLLMLHYKATRGLLATNLIILNHGSVVMTPELAPFLQSTTSRY